ncbi:MAG: hypothetical protein AAFQ82_07910 [Myxococcota bacterium]
MEQLTLSGMKPPAAFQVGQRVKVRGRYVETLGIDHRMPGGVAVVVQARSDRKGDYYAVEFQRNGRRRFVRPDELRRYSTGR